MVKRKQESLALKEDSYVDIEAEKICEEIKALPAKAQTLFWAHLENTLAGAPISDKALCAKVGASQQYLCILKADPRWARAWGDVVSNITRSKSHKWIDNLEKKADAGDIQANKILLQVSNMVKNNQNINVNLNTGQNLEEKTPVELLDSMLISLGKLGLSADAILNRYIELKNQGAF